MSMEENTGSSHGTFSDVSPITTSWYHEDSPSSLLQSPMMLGVKAQLHRLTCAAVLCDGIVQLDTQDCFCPGTFWGRERTHKHTQCWSPSATTPLISSTLKVRLYLAYVNVV